MIQRRWKVVVATLGILVFALALGVIVRGRSRDQRLSRSVREALDLKQFDEASRILDRWSALRPGDGEPDYYRARIYVTLDEPAEAMSAMRRAIEHGYPSEPILILRAVLQTRALQFSESEPILRRAFEASAEPKPEIAESLARLYLATFRLPEASRALERWMEAAPQDARPYLLRNEIDERRGTQPISLVRNYREALRLDPTLDNARLGLAEILLKLRRVEESEIEYTAYLSRNPRSVAGNVGAGQIAVLKGDFQAADRYFAETLAADPKNAVALNQLGLSDLRSSRFTSARDRFKTAVDVEPFDPEVRYNYAKALKMSGEETLATEVIGISDRLRKDNDRIVDLRQALADHPNDADLRREAAKWLIEHGHEKEGLEWTELILRQSPGHPSTCQLLVDFHTKKGNFGLANYYKTAGQINKDSSMR